MSTDSLSTTSFAVLGLVAIRPWAAYDLTGYMRTSAVRAFWPRTESRLYQEPKNLVALGLLKATQEYTGKRSRTVYSITPAGRRALSLWLDERPTAPRVEDEAMLKVTLADHGTKDQLLQNIRWAMENLHEQIVSVLESAPRVARGEGHFPGRQHMSLLAGRQMLGMMRARLDYLRWAEQWVDGWQSTRLDSARKKESMAIGREIVQGFESIEAELQEVLGRDPRYQDEGPDRENDPSR